jgi:hypothetical protein
VTGSFNLNDSATNFNILGNQFGETYLISNNGNIVLHPVGDSEGIVIVKETDLTVEGDITVNNLYASNGVVSGSSQIVEYNVFATTGSNQFNGSQAITGSLTVTGQVVAQTLNVQQVTSSIIYSSGSNVFGNDLGNTQQFTGSVSVTGSLTVNGVSATLSEYVPYTGATADVNLGNNDLSSKYITSEGSAGLGGLFNIKQDAIYLPKGNGYSSIASSFAAFDFYGYTGASTYKNFQLRFDGLTNNTLRTYTLPNADGTLALTSNLSAYLPLTGGTLTGALNGTSATFTGNVNVNGEGTYIGIDAQATPRLGFVKVSGAQPFLAFAADPFTIKVSNGSTIATSNTFATALTIATTGAACFACELTAKSLGTNDLILNNLNHDHANYVDGTRGSWLIQEGACDLFIINQVSCKKYKFNLIEIN